MTAVPPLLLAITDAAQALGIGRTSTYDLIRSGEIQTVSIKNRRLVVAASLHEYVDRIANSDRSAFGESRPSSAATSADCSETPTTARAAGSTDPSAT